VLAGWSFPNLVFFSKWNNRIMKSLKVSKEIWQQVKVEAAKQNITINEFVTQALKAKLKQSVADDYLEEELRNKQEEEKQ
jgi:hypothetical protein